VKKLYSDIDSRRSRVVARNVTRKKGEKISLKQFEVSVFDFFQTREKERSGIIWWIAFVFYIMAN
jgi:hypothetical protein